MRRLAVSKIWHAAMVCFGMLVLLIAVLNLAGVTNARWFVSSGLVLMIVYSSLRMRSSARITDPFGLRRDRSFLIRRPRS